MSEALAALRGLLEAYDRENRLKIDAVYAQFSPTLDDFYAEALRIAFPPTGPGARAAAAAGTRAARRGVEHEPADAAPAPEIVLTRTVPGLPPRSARASGAPFPLAHAAALVRAALAAPATAATPAAGGLLARIEAGSAWLAPAQAGGSQAVRLLVMPDSVEILSLLAAFQSSARRE